MHQKYVRPAGKAGLFFAFRFESLTKNGNASNGMHFMFDFEQSLDGIFYIYATGLLSLSENLS
jgi:hypothetical protein